MTPLTPGTLIRSFSSSSGYGAVIHDRPPDDGSVSIRVPDSTYGLVVSGRDIVPRHVLHGRKWYLIIARGQLGWIQLTSDRAWREVT